MSAQKIEPGDGYRLLNAGETRRIGDEYWDGDEWRPTSLDGRPLGKFAQPSRRPIIEKPARKVRRKSVWDLANEQYIRRFGKLKTEEDRQLRDFFVVGHLEGYRSAQRRAKLGIAGGRTT